MVSGGPDRVRGKTVLVVGFGRSGQAAAELLLRHGAHVVAVDDDAETEHRVDTGGWRSRGVRTDFGPDGPDRVGRADLVVVSPGVPRSSSWMNWARGRGVPVAGEIECASWFAQAPMAVITGTNGKSTTTELLGQVVRESGTPVEVGGNIGRALSGVADRVPAEGWIVAEVSSFQLETIHAFRPRVAIFLNLTPDHLDRYPSVDEYQGAKERVFENQTREDVAVLNRDDPRVWSAAARIRSRVLATSLAGSVDEGAWVDGGTIVARVAETSSVICPVEEMSLRGPHNLANALAVAAAGLWMGIPAQTIAATLGSFRGLAHRMESLGKIRGVEFVNDSKATNVEAVLSALASFTAPVVLIGGGLGKGLDFTPLAEAARGRVKRAILIGEAREQMGRVLGRVAEVETADSMAEAVEGAMRAADPGDVVLLSPSCASFDMFENFEDRGDHFRMEVERLRDAIA